MSAPLSQVGRSDLAPHETMVRQQTRILSRSLTLSNRLHQTINLSAQTPTLLECTKQSQDCHFTIRRCDQHSTTYRCAEQPCTKPHPPHSVSLMKSLPSMAATRPSQNTSDVILITFIGSSPTAVTQPLSFPEADGKKLTEVMLPGMSRLLSFPIYLWLSEQSSRLRHRHHPSIFEG